MGSKGTQTVQNVGQNQTYTANQMTQNAANQALSGAQTAASQPFQMPVAPVAGFDPQQQQAFQQYGQLQGSYQPYFNQAANYTSQSAAPVTAADVNNVYNPMAANVTANLQDIFGQQNVQNQGASTARAGGVGADRIAVGMGNLAKEQTLGAGQTYANLYQQALQTAMQQKQLQAGAGGQFAAYGTGQLGAGLQATNALNQAGNQEQAQAQAQLNAPYQNQLAQIAYQFQTPQYLASIAGGLAPALGGTTTGYQNSVTTPPQPSLLSQGLGIATAGAGLYGALGGGYDSGGSNLGYTNVGGYTMPTYSARGGGVEGYAEGGETDDTGPAVPGVTIPKAGHLSPIPMVSLPAGAGHSGPLTGGMSFPAPQQSSGQGETLGGDIGGVLKAAASIAPFFMLKRGGTIPYMDANGDVPIGNKLPKGYDDGGGIDWGDLATGFPTPDTNGRSFNDRFRDAFPAATRSTTPAPAVVSNTGLTNPNPVPAGTVPLPTGSPERIAANKKAEDSGAFRLDPSAKPAEGDEEVGASAKLSPSERYKASGRASAAPWTQANPYMMPQAQQPYPDSLKRDWGQNMARSPWLALVKAGATMAATPGPLGVSLGKGMLAGTAGLEGQRKELRSEQELNDKAQQLYQNAQVHLDKYTKMTPTDAGNLAARNREIDQSGAATGTDPKTQRAIASRAAYLYGIKAKINENQIDPRLKKTDEQMSAEAYLEARQFHGQEVGAPAVAPAVLVPEGEGPEPKNPAVGQTWRFQGGARGVFDGTKWGPVK